MRLTFHRQRRFRRARLVSAGYLAPVTAEVKAWDGYGQLLDVAKKLSTGADGQMYPLDSMLGVHRALLPP